MKNFKVKSPILSLALSLLFLSSSAFATNYFYDKDLPVSKNIKIKITKYEPVAGGVFTGYSVDFDGEGSFYTKAEHLSKSVKKLTYRQAHKNPKSLVGKTFLLSQKLDTVIPPPFKAKPKKK